MVMGEKSCNLISEIATAHGCIAKCLGNLSKRMASFIVALISGDDRSSRLSSGNSLIADAILRALIWGIDFANKSICIRSAPKAAPASLMAWRAR